MKKRRLTFSLLTLAIGLSTSIEAQELTEYGPQNGTLVIVGGGSMDGTGIIERFIELGGGAQQLVASLRKLAPTRRAGGRGSFPESHSSRSTTS